MRKFLIAFVQVAMILLAASCGNDPDTEGAFIDRGSVDPPKPPTDIWAWADKYPGPVGANVPKLDNIEVTVKGGYDKTNYHAYGASILQSTDLYAALDEYITIEVPGGVTDLCYQIGIGFPLAEGQARRRYTDILTSGTLAPGENTISSPFGGFIYVYYPEDKVPAGDIVITVSGGRESYPFYAGETNEGEWLATMQERSRLLRGETTSETETTEDFIWWTELHGEKSILFAGVGELYMLSNPKTLMDNYDRLVDVFCQFAGINFDGQMPLRIYTDVQLPNPAEGTLGANEVFRYGGYPAGMVRGGDQTSTDVTNGLRDSRFVVSTSLTQLVEDPRFPAFFFNAMAYTFEETFGGDWTRLSAVNTSWRNLANYYFFRHPLNPNRGNSPADLPSSAPVMNFVRASSTLIQNFNEIESNYFTKNGYLTMFFAQRVDFTTNLETDMTTLRATFYWWLAKQYGWGLISYVNQQSHAEQFLNEWEQDSWDFFAMCACEYANKDLRPYFNAWCYPYTMHANDYMATFPPEENEWWKTSLVISDEPNYDPIRTGINNSNRPRKSYAKWATPTLASSPDADPSTYWNVEYYMIDSLFTGDTTEFPTGNYVWDDELGEEVPEVTKVFYNSNCFQDASFTNFNNQQYTTEDRDKLAELGYDLTLVSIDTCYKVLHAYVNFDRQVTFNAISFLQNHDGINTSMMYEMEWWDESAGEWKPMYTMSGGTDIRLNRPTNTYYYFFPQEYTTNRWRFKGRPRGDACRIHYLGVGTTSPDNPAPRPSEN